MIFWRVVVLSWRGGKLRKVREILSYGRNYDRSYRNSVINPATKSPIDQRGTADLMRV